MTVFSLWNPAMPGFAVALFVDEPFDFDRVDERSVVVPLQETPVRVIALEDLLEMKRTSGRPQDLADLEALSALDACDPRA